MSFDMEMATVDETVEEVVDETEESHELTMLTTQNNKCNANEMQMPTLEPNYEESFSNGFTANTLLKETNTDITMNSDHEEKRDTVASRMDLQQTNCIKIKRAEACNEQRKESFEQRLRRAFTIKNAHRSEVTKRLIEIVVKYSLFVFNFVSWILATAAIALSIWMKLDKTLLVTSDTEFYLNLPMMMCAGGCITFIVASLGCIGALRENMKLLRVFFYVLTVILLGEMMLGTAVFIIYTVPEARDSFLKSQPEKILSSAITKYMDDNEIKNWVDKIQSEFRCCGIAHTDEGFRDWQHSLYFNCTPSNKSIYRCAVPMSCCIFEKGDRVNTMCGFDMTNKSVKDVGDYIYTRGCIVGFGEWLGKYHSLIIISCLSIIIMQVLAVLSAKLMVVRITKKRARWCLLQNRTNINKTDTI